MAEDDQYEQMKSSVMNEVTDNFRPEFINRIDEVVVFHALRKSEVRAITELQIELLSKRLENQEMCLIVNSDALELVSNAGFDPAYGARPIKRVIQNLIETPLAEALLSGQFEKGDTIEISRHHDLLTFNTSRTQAEQQH